MLEGMFQKEERLAFPNATVVHVVVVNGCRYPGLLEALWIENKNKIFNQKNEIKWERFKSSLCVVLGAN